MPAEYKLYLMRHASAEEGDPMDFSRPLLGRGEDEAKDAADWLENIDQAPDGIMSAPVLRGQQTADIMRDRWGGDIEYQTSANLQPDGKTAKAWSDIENFLCREHPDTDERRVLVVTHMPLLGEIVRYLTGIDPENMQFKTGSIMRIDFENDVKADNNQGRLRWLVTPKAMRETP